MIFTDIGADSKLLSLIRGNFWAIDSVLRALQTVSAHSLAVAVDVGAACEIRSQQHRDLSLERIMNRDNGSGRSGDTNAREQKEEESLEVIERLEVAARHATREALLEASLDGGIVIDA
jgi:hypothetical protein